LNIDGIALRLMCLVIFAAEYVMIESAVIGV